MSSHTTEHSISNDPSASGAAIFTELHRDGSIRSDMGAPFLYLELPTVGLRLHHVVMQGVTSLRVAALSSFNDVVQQNDEHK